MPLQGLMSSTYARKKGLQSNLNSACGHSHIVSEQLDIKVTLFLMIRHRNIWPFTQSAG